MSKEKRESEAAVAANKELFDHLRVAAILVPAVIYMVGMVGKLGKVNTIMIEEGFELYAEAPKNLWQLISTLDILRVPGDVLTLADIQNMQFAFFVALFITLVTTAVYATRSYVKHRQRNTVGSRFVIGSKAVSNNRYFRALRRVKDDDSTDESTKHTEEPVNTEGTFSQHSSQKTHPDNT